MQYQSNARKCVDRVAQYECLTVVREKCPCAIIGPLLIFVQSLQTRINPYAE
jgi:hypothetical protein